METRIVEKKLRLILTQERGQIELTFKDGSSKIASQKDLFLTQNGFKEVSDLTLDDELILKEQV
jgi:hypothetical protein